MANGSGTIAQTDRPAREPRIKPRRCYESFLVFEKGTDIGAFFAPYLMNRTDEATIHYEDPSHLQYEVGTWWRNATHWIFIKILSLMSFAKFFIIKSNRAAKHVIDNATTHEALETLYQSGGSHPPKNGLQKIFHHVWFNVDNSKAVRNRLKLVQREIRSAVELLISNNKPVNILSIASGSARSIITVVEHVDDRKLPISISFLDKNPKAIEYSRNLSTNLINKYRLKWFVDTASNFPKYYEFYKPNIIEMVGLLDYFDDQKAESIFRIIYENLEPGGFFITANICDNHERKFVTNVVGWKMIYRDAHELIEIAKKAGFDSKNIKVHYEPLKIHCVLIARK